MILPLEQQVCSLDSARRLKDLGFSQESLFYWTIGKSDNKVFIVQGKPESNTMLELEKPVGKQHYIQEIEFSCSAFTVAELGKLLPVAIQNGKYWQRFRTENYGDPVKFRVQYMRRSDDGQYPCDRTPFEAISEENEAESRAKMLCYLVENKLIEVMK